MTRTERLGDVCDMRSGGTPRRGVDGYYGGTIPWVTIADMSASDGVVRRTAETITESGLAAIGNRVFEPGTILLAMYGSVGKLAVAGSRLATNQAILGLRPRNPDALDARYLIRWLSSIQPKLIFDARGVTQSNISKGLVEELAIPVPPLPQQRRIADILDKADSIRRKRMEAIALTEELLRSVFLETFGDPLTNPKRWQVKQFAEIVANTQLGLDRAAVEQGKTRAYPYVRMNAIRIDGRLDLSTLTRVNATEAEVTSYQLQDGDFLFNTRNSRELVGKSAVYHGNGTHLYNNNIMRVRFHAGVEADFVSAYWQTSAAQQQLDVRKVGTTSVFAIYFKSLATLPVPVPPASLQAKYAAFCAAARKSLDRHTEHATEAGHCFDSLLLRAFDGRLSGTGDAC